ncbi:helix-turn-helix domain-containing protein [Brevibacillus brevis]|nr:helix-turn-helix domain-containing protein [Brevibacillus brevis]
MDHNFLSDKQISEIEERYKSLQQLMMMDVDALIKEVRAYRKLLKNTEKERLKSMGTVRLDQPQVDEEMLKDYHDVLTPKEIQNILGIGRRQTYELLNSGDLLVERVGKSMRISKRVFLNWIKGQ